MNLLSIDLDAFADLDVWFITIALLVAFGIFMVVRYDMRRLRITAPDPFFYPIGDVPNLPPMPSGSIFEGSARRAAPAGQGSGGNGKSSQGPAAVGPSSPSSWRGQRAH